MKTLSFSLLYCTPVAGFVLSRLNTNLGQIFVYHFCYHGYHTNYCSLISTIYNSWLTKWNLFINTSIDLFVCYARPYVLICIRFLPNLSILFGSFIHHISGVVLNMNGYLFLWPIWYLFCTQDAKNWKKEKRDYWCHCYSN